MILIGTVRCNMKDLMAYWPTESGVQGMKHVEGFFIALMLKNAPGVVRAGFETEKARDAMMRRLDKQRKVKA